MVHVRLKTANDNLRSNVSEKLDQLGSEIAEFVSVNNHEVKSNDVHARLQDAINNQRYNGCENLVLIEVVTERSDSFSINNH